MSRFDKAVRAVPDQDARALVESGLLNWSGPATHVMLCSSDGEIMMPEVAKSCVDFAFATPRPTLHLELVDEDGRGWPAAWFAVEYARRKAEWRGRGLSLSYRAPSRPTSEREDFLRAQRVALRASVRRVEDVFPAARARVLVGAKANPDAWVDALASAGVGGVEWIPDGVKDFAGFARRALARIFSLAESSELRDETLIALLAARPLEVPGVDLFETLAYSPDGTLLTSERGWPLGRASSARFQDLPSEPIVPALAAALARDSQPLCGLCAYRRFCAIPPSRHQREQGSLHGRLPDSAACAERMGLLDLAFSLAKDDEKCLKALEKWNVDISILSC